MPSAEAWKLVEEAEKRVRKVDTRIAWAKKDVPSTRRMCTKYEEDEKEEEIIRGRNRGGERGYNRE